MKSQYFHSVPRNDDDVKEIWKNAIIVLDTNTLLNLYRWSDATSSQFADVLSEVSERLWLPDQVAHEYFKNREGAITEAKKSYDTALTDIRNIQQKFDAKRGHPHLSPKIHKKLSGLTAEIIAELEQSGKNQHGLYSSDPTRDKILELYDGKVGTSFTEEQTKAHFEAANNRFKEQIPPGYLDIKKAEGGKQTDLRAAYGDYLIWRQTMDFAKEAVRDIIFVCDDNKEDWYKKSKDDSTIGPRPELLLEFFEETSRQVAIYKPQRFMELAQQNLKSSFTAEAIQEVREVSNRDFERKRKNLLKSIQDQSDRQRLLSHYLLDETPDELSKHLSLTKKGSGTPEANSWWQEILKSTHVEKNHTIPLAELEKRETERKEFNALLDLISAMESRQKDRGPESEND